MKLRYMDGKLQYQEPLVTSMCYKDWKDVPHETSASSEVGKTSGKEPLQFYDPTTQTLHANKPSGKECEHEYEKVTMKYNQKFYECAKCGEQTGIELDEPKPKKLWEILFLSDDHENPDYKNLSSVAIDEILKIVDECNLGITITNKDYINQAICLKSELKQRIEEMR